jgi:hypothetical protein
LTKLPATKSKESIPLAPQELQEMVKHRDWGDVPKAKATTAAELNQLHKRGLVSEEALAEGKAALESGAGAAQVPISRPPEGHRLTVKAPTGMLKSKWSVDGPPRPSTAAPPPMPTDAKLNKCMQIELVATSELEGAKKRLVDAAVAAAAKAAKAKADKEHLQGEAAAAAAAEATAKAKSAEPSMVDLINAIRTERKESGVAPEQVPALDQVVALLPHTTGGEPLPSMHACAQHGALFPTGSGPAPSHHRSQVAARAAVHRMAERRWSDDRGAHRHLQARARGAAGPRSAPLRAQRRRGHGWQMLPLVRVATRRAADHPY